MDWMLYTLVWYVALFFLGITALPLTRVIFGKFVDQGYSFAKPIGLLILSYAAYVLSTLHLIPFEQAWLWAILIGFGAINFFIQKKRKISEQKTRKIMILSIAQEILFFFSLLFWAYIRAHKPEINGLEKFMDYGFIKSALNTTFFPAKDIWLAGETINYYYFGHVTGAVLIKLTGIPAYIGYNLILATLFALGITETFSIGLNFAYKGLKKSMKQSALTGALATFLVNLGGNLHPIYAFTKGYQNDVPSPFWQLEPKYSFSDLKHLATATNALKDFYWYPNATRFIPYTIHEFPIYSYVVADLHGHVFDIPFVLLTIAYIFNVYVHSSETDIKKTIKSSSPINWMRTYFRSKNTIVPAIILGFMTAIHFMTNAFDAPIYLLLSFALFFIMYFISWDFVIHSSIVVLSFLFFSLPFRAFFDSFASGIGVNCAPDFLTKIGSYGPFLFEAQNCQISEWWMLVTLWGFFWFNFIFFSIFALRRFKYLNKTDMFVMVLFALGTLLIAIPEVIYAKDIYPSHFRANTMFKLGYQAFIMMSIASAYTFVRLKNAISKMPFFIIGYLMSFTILFGLVAIYPTFAIESFYNPSTKDTNLTLDGQEWIQTSHPEYFEIITYLNEIKGQPVILEAQGDSYTEYNIVSANTGYSTVAGWWVHEWLWRGDSQVVGKIIPDIEALYQSTDNRQTLDLIEKYHIEYIIVGPNEKEKYVNLNEKKFEALGQAIFRTSSGNSTIYKMSLDK